MSKRKLVELTLEKKKKEALDFLSSEEVAGSWQKISASRNLLSQTSAATEPLLQKRGRKIAVLKGKEFARPHVTNLTIKC
jgi:hypothetical protein